MNETGVTERLELPELRERLEDADLGALRAKVDDRLHRSGVTFGSRLFAVDPVPRVIAAAEWEELRAGIVQRVRALEAFLADAYGPRRRSRPATPIQPPGGRRPASSGS